MHNGLIGLIIGLVIIVIICVIICSSSNIRNCYSNCCASSNMSIPQYSNLSSLTVSDDELSELISRLTTLMKTYNYNDINTGFINPLKAPTELTEIIEEYGEENAKAVFYEIFVNTMKGENINKEGFISVGGNGAVYNKGQDVFMGDAIFTNQILQGDYNKGDLIKQVQETGYMNDANTALGARPGGEYQCAMTAHIKNQQLLEGADNEYIQNNIMAEVNKNINETTDSIPSQSIYNRGAQNKGKIIDLPNGIVGILPDEYYPERSKNQNIYKAKVVFPMPGFDIHEDRIGNDLSGVHFAEYLPKRNQKRQPTSSGATANTWTPNPDPVEKETFEANKNRFNEQAKSIGISGQKYGVECFEDANGDKMYRMPV